MNETIVCIKCDKSKPKDAFGVTPKHGKTCKTCCDCLRIRRNKYQAEYAKRTGHKAMRNARRKSGIKQYPKTIIAERVISVVGAPDFDAEKATHLLARVSTRFGPAYARPLYAIAELLTQIEPEAKQLYNTVEKPAT